MEIFFLYKKYWRSWLGWVSWACDVLRTRIKHLPWWILIFVKFQKRSPSNWIEFFFYCIVERRKTISLISSRDLTIGNHSQRSLRPLSKTLTILKPWHYESRIWTCAEPKFRVSWMKLCSSDNHYTTAPC